MAVISLWLNLHITKVRMCLCACVCLCATKKERDSHGVCISEFECTCLCICCFSVDMTNVSPPSVCATTRGRLPPPLTSKHTNTQTHAYTLCHLFALALLLVPHSPTPHLHNKPPHPQPHTPLLSFLPERPCPNQTQQINNSTCRSCHGINYAQRVSLIRGLSAGCPWHVSGCPCVSAAQR